MSWLSFAFLVWEQLKLSEYASPSFESNCLLECPWLTQPYWPWFQCQGKKHLNRRGGSRTRRVGPFLFGKCGHHHITPTSLKMARQQIQICRAAHLSLPSLPLTTAGGASLSEHNPILPVLLKVLEEFWTTVPRKKFQLVKKLFQARMEVSSKLSSLVIVRKRAVDSELPFHVKHHISLADQNRLLWFVY